MGMADESGAARALRALLQASGVRVALRVATREAEVQAGTAAMDFEERDCGPGVLRAEDELLLSADARVLTLVAMSDVAGVLVHGEKRALESWRALESRGGVYGYSLKLGARQGGL